jgi:hypothetical protein
VFLLTPRSRTSCTTSRPIQILVQREQRHDLPDWGYAVYNDQLFCHDHHAVQRGGSSGSGFIKIDDEIIVYGYITGNTLYNCFRGQQGTTAASHTSGTAV